jgi:hypothetical protein
MLLSRQGQLKKERQLKKETKVIFIGLVATTATISQSSGSKALLLF